MTRESELKYTSEHEWVEAADGVATVGITGYAAGQLGDVVYVDLPAAGTAVEAGAVIGEIESTKSVGELYAPVSGTIAAVNDAVEASPELVNSDPLGDGWLVRIEYSDLPALLELAEYQALTSES
ncbi:glycine cleavage system protein GcvH [Herbiconiux sp. L3-i23]|uniref:glycine cleavage system protein GcvH n=1 Tax=Herbiconiux sp. L3-i23 TaxID=2905871 RepID=UPI002062E859|nr:glycine cleavage system protein GcvH [Herbiconiux sp. L3-i23]BDI23512.1 glycine cleavage system H protein [Herbiconiux sp. L3-i23]